MKIQSLTLAKKLGLVAFPLLAFCAGASSVNAKTHEFQFSAQFIDGACIVDSTSTNDVSFGTIDLNENENTAVDGTYATADNIKLVFNCPLSSPTVDLTFSSPTVDGTDSTHITNGTANGISGVYLILKQQGVQNALDQSGSTPIQVVESPDTAGLTTINFTAELKRGAGELILNEGGFNASSTVTITQN